MGDLGVYIHYPWCRSLCPYCDFPVALGRPGKIPHEAYAAAVLSELDGRAEAFAGRELVSIYFGGGTPSLWPARYLARVIEAVRARLGPGRAALEVTIEANPTDCQPAIMAEWKRAGINRLSIGVQSFDQADLVTLGRDHQVGDGPSALALATAAGFSSVSADLIFGTPGQLATKALEPSVARMAEAGCEHLSVYELTFESATLFGKAQRAGRLAPLPDPALEEKYVAIHELLTARGYEHYEISSYALPGFRSVHNSLYWNGGEFLGIGCGAASFRIEPGGGAVRRTNLRSAPRYLRAHGTDRAGEICHASPEEVAQDRLWLALRTSDGAVDADLQPHAGLCDWLLRSGLATAAGGRIRPTLRGFLCADRVAKRVVGA